jgi:hypothetical protein
MMINIWVIYRADGDRPYTRTTQPSDSQMAAYRKEGFEIFRAQVNLPVDETVSIAASNLVGQPDVYQRAVTAERVESSDAK